MIQECRKSSRENQYKAFHVWRDGIAMKGTGYCRQGSFIPHGLVIQYQIDDSICPTTEIPLVGFVFRNGCGIGFFQHHQDVDGNHFRGELRELDGPTQLKFAEALSDMMSGREFSQTSHPVTEDEIQFLNDL